MNILPVNLIEEENTLYELQKEYELRIELSPKEIIKIIIESGYAEIEGAELPINFPLTFTNKRFAIFCWSDCKIRVVGKVKNIYESSSNQSAMIQYLMVHNIIHEHRTQSLSKNILGPNILIIGSISSGKNILSHILLNYALKLGWTPIYVDLDLSNEISIPGTISAAPVDYVVPNDFLIDNSISLFHGNNINDISLPLYELQIKEMANLVNNKLNQDLYNFKKKYYLEDPEADEKILEYYNDSITSEKPTLYSSGSIIQCPNINASEDGLIYKTIIEEFEIQYVFVIENEKLFNAIKTIKEKYIKNNLKNNLNVSILQKTQGINYDETYKDYIEQKRFDAYFKGPFNNIKITEFKLEIGKYKLIQIINLNITSALLTIGSKSEIKLLLKEVNVNEENLTNKILAITHLEENVITDLENNFESKLNLHLDSFTKSPIAFYAYM